jgi:hypothetical protein
MESSVLTALTHVAAAAPPARETGATSANASRGATKPSARFSARLSTAALRACPRRARRATGDAGGR